MTVAKGKKASSRDALLVEYEATQSMLQHYDGFRWQSGAMIHASAVVFLGLITASNPSSSMWTFASTATALLLSIWILFSAHHRHLYMFKIDRLLELEEVLGAEQHRRFNAFTGVAKIYPRIGPRGHQLDVAIFVLLSFTGPGLAAVSRGMHLGLLLPLMIVIVVAVVIVINERRVLKWLRDHRTSVWPRG